MKKYIAIIVLLIVVLIGSLSYCLFQLNKQSKIIESQKKLIVKLTPRFNGQDTLSLLGAMINLKEFNSDTKLLDTAKTIKIDMFPYITKKYTLFKFNKSVYVGRDYTGPGPNTFYISLFRLLDNDSARIEFKFNDGWMGIINAKKINGKWNVIKSEIGRY